MSDLLASLSTLELKGMVWSTSPRCSHKIIIKSDVVVLLFRCLFCVGIQIAPWRIEDPEDIVEIGQLVRVRLLDIRDDGKLQLTMKGLNPDIKPPENYGGGRMPEEGSVYEGKVVSIRPFGAFVNFGFARDGLVHVSQMADYHVSDPEQVVAVGDKVKILVQSVEPSGRIALTFKGEGLGVTEEAM